MFGGKRFSSESINCFFFLYLGEKRKQGDDESTTPPRRTSLTKTFMSDVNLNEKESLTNSNEDNNYQASTSVSSETSFNANIENDHVSSSNIANNYIYLLNSDLNRITSSEFKDSNHLNQYLPVYRPVKLLNNILNDSLTTTSSSTISINNNNSSTIATANDVIPNDYDYIYSKYNQYKNSSNLMQTFKSIQLQTNEDRQQKL